MKDDESHVVLLLISLAVVKFKELSVVVERQIVFNSIGFVVICEGTSIPFGSTHLGDNVNNLLVISNIKWSTKCLFRKCM